MDCLISIVIPFYRTAKALFDRCMNSILSVPDEVLEVVVIDDGSPEEFRAVLEPYKKDRRVRIVHKENGGVSAARNLGAAMANGKWLMFVDSDDYVNTKALRKLLAFTAEQTGEIILFTGARDNNGIIQNNTTFLQENVNYAETPEQKHEVMASALSVGMLPAGYRQFFSLGAPYCKLIRTDFLRKNKIAFEEKLRFAEDTLFSLELYQCASDIRFVDLMLYYYVSNEESVTRHYRAGLSAEMDSFFRYISQFIRKNNLQKALQRAFYVRAQFEVGRAFTLEYFHPENKDPHAAAAYRQFKQKEPYRTALQKNYMPKGPLTRQVRRILAENGCGRLYHFSNFVLQKVRSLCRH